MNESPQVLALQERYKASFPEKRRLILDLRNSFNNGGDIAEVKQELHKLAGSSGMYGYSNIASICREAMDSIDSEHQDKVNGFLDRLIDLLDHQG